MAEEQFCPHGIRNGPENCIACEDPTKLGSDLPRRIQLSIDGFARGESVSTWVNNELLKEAKAEIEWLTRELRFMRAQRDAALRARDALHAALDRIRKIGPLGVDTYRECYRRMRAIAVEALNGEPS